MSTGIPRAPVYPEMPVEPLSNSQVESLVAFQNIDEHRELVTEIFGLDTDEPYTLSESDLRERHLQMEVARNLAYRYSRSASELGHLVLATVSQMEDEVRRQTLLDIGCGTGRFGEDMARKAKAEVTFLDRDPEMLEQVSKRAGKIVLGEGTELPFEDESFQKVLAGFSSIHWAETPEQSVRALNEAIRVTEVGGSTIVIPLINSIHARRALLPVILSQRQPNGEFEDMDRYAVVWAMQDLAVTNALFGLAEGGYCDITWANHVDQLGTSRVTRELYSAVIDKKANVPSELLEQSVTEARQMVRS